jgi:hypothetical protein
MSKEQTMGLIRHALTFIGGILVSHGVTNDATITELIGCALTLVGGIWSMVNNKPAAQQ